MAATGTAQGKATRLVYDNASIAATFSIPGTMPDWAEIVGAGTTVLVDEAGNSVSLVTDSAQPNRVVPGPWSGFTSTSATRVLMGNGRMPQVAIPGTGAAAGVSILDAGTFTAQTNAEAALQEIYQNLFSAVGGYVSIPLSEWRIVSSTGDVGNIAAIGGALASDSDPSFDAVATSNEHEILWAANSVIPIGVSIALPRDFDDTADAFLDLEVASGSTNAASIVCASAWSAGAAGTEVSDTADDSSLKSATPHRVTVTIDKGDIPAGTRRATFRLTPPGHSTNAISLKATGLAYKRKLLVA